MTHTCQAVLWTGETFDDEPIVRRCPHEGQEVYIRESEVTEIVPGIASRCTLGWYCAEHLPTRVEEVAP